MRNLTLVALLSGIMSVGHALAQDATQGIYAFRMAPAASIVNATATRQDILRVGVLEMDGYGKASGRATATNIDSTGATWIIEFSFTGDYALHADGTGFLRINPTVSSLACQNSTTIPVTPVMCPVGVEPSQLFAFAFGFNHLDNREIDLIEVSNVNGAASKVFLAGKANLQ